MKIAYFDCFSGISGDMILGALMDLGVSKGFIEEIIRRLPLEDFRLEVASDQRMAIRGQRVQVVVEGKDRARNYKEIRSLLEESRLPDATKGRSLAVFSRLAQVESAIHGCPEDEVHFHELGGVDAIVDIVGTALGMESLGIDRVIASPIPLGRGFVTCHHGVLPVPAPATVSLLKGAPVYGTDVPHELVTPTGAAIITSLAESFGPLPAMKIKEVGYGIGSRNLKEMPNMLRVLVGEPVSSYGQDVVTIVETNIDDMNPEIFGYVMERLLEDGALDVIWIPVFMKKNRPGTMIQVLCRETDREKIVQRILAETTAIGVRHAVMERTTLPRKVKEVTTSLGLVRVKEIPNPEGELSVVPEYEDCHKIAREKNIPLKKVYETVMKESS
jgi:hypothetical protein